MLVTAWHKNQKVEMTKPGSKNHYKVTYWNGTEKWVDQYPGAGQKSRREERLKEKNQSKPSIKNAKEKLNAAVKGYIDGKVELSGAAGIVDNLIVKLGS